MIKHSREHTDRFSEMQLLFSNQLHLADGGGCSSERCSGVSEAQAQILQAASRWGNKHATNSETFLPRAKQWGDTLELPAETRQLKDERKARCARLLTKAVQCVVCHHVGRGTNCLPVFWSLRVSVAFVIKVCSILNKVFSHLVFQQLRYRFFT